MAPRIHNDCSICFHPLTASPAAVLHQTENVTHEFHVACLAATRVFSHHVNAKCPLCEKQMTDREVVQVSTAYYVDQTGIDSNIREEALKHATLSFPPINLQGMFEQAMDRSTLTVVVSGDGKVKFTKVEVFLLASKLFELDEDLNSDLMNKALKRCKVDKKLQDTEEVHEAVKAEIAIDFSAISTNFNPAVTIALQTITDAGQELDIRDLTRITLANISLLHGSELTNIKYCYELEVMLYLLFQATQEKIKTAAESSMSKEGAVSSVVTKVTEDSDR